MYLDGKPVLHVVDRDTKFGAACFLENETTSGTWEAFLYIWVAPYIGFPDMIAVDQGPQFISAEWRNLTQAAGIKVKQSGIEHHNAIGTGERYHAYLRRIYNKVRMESPSLSSRMALSLSVKATNDTAGPSGLVPSLLVFGVMPRLPVRHAAIPYHTKRMRAAISARKEMTEVISKRRLDYALQHRVPAEADALFSPGDEVLMYREKSVAKWVGPYIIQNILDGRKVVELNTGDRMIMDFLDKIKKYRTKDTAVEVPDNQKTDGQREVEDLDRLMRSFWPVDAHEEVPKVDEIEEFVVEIIENTDPQSEAEDFIEAKKIEIEGMKKRDTWTVVSHEVVPTNANILGGRFVLTLKNFSTPNEKAEARFVAHGYCDQVKNEIIHDSSTIRPSSIRIILSTAANLSFNLFSHDVMQAYLQSKDKLT